MNKGVEIASGKTKILYENPGHPDQLVVAQTDQISAGDGARRSVIAGKGRLAAQTTARVFRLLNLCGLPTHYISGGEDDDNNEMLVRRCNMLPLEVVVRGVAAGSFVRRNPGVTRGMLLVPRVIEFFVKDDANHDPQIAPDEIVARGIATPAEVGAMSELARLTFDILSHAWRRRDVLLVDLKIEFGRLTAGNEKGQLVIADVIDNDSWRIWPQGREDRMLDKQLYRNLESVDDAALATVKAAYEEVADLVGTFPVMRREWRRVIADAPERSEALNAVASDTAIAWLADDSSRRESDADAGLRAPARATARSDVCALVLRRGAEDDTLRAMLDAASSAPVIAWTGDSAALALQCSKLLALDDTVLYGRTLLDAGQRALRRAARGRRVLQQAGTAGSEACELPRCFADELTRIRERLGREPSPVELHAFDAQWSEHCSYKSSRHQLKRLPTTGSAVVLGPAEDSGILHLGEWNGERYGIVIAHESHNHPSQVVPFEGAATGIGGIVRDVLCMGAQVIAVADPLRFGRIEDAHSHQRYVAQGVVDGISAYGNAIGVPNIAGDLYFDERFDDNCLVNVVAMGIVKESRGHPFVCAARRRRMGHRARRARRPIRAASAALRSRRSRSTHADEDSNKGAVQVPDPFLKSVIMRASYRVFSFLHAQGLTVGFKDLGAGGIMGCSAEITSRPADTARGSISTRSMSRLRACGPR